MRKLLIGLIVIIILTMVSMMLSTFTGVLSSSTIGLLLGVLINIDYLSKSSKFVEKKVLPFSIALLGFTISVDVIFEVGLPIVLFCILMIFVLILVSLLLGKFLNVEGDTPSLIGSGNAVCGSSAILSVKGVLNSNETETASSIAVINLLGLISLFVLPIIISLLGITDNQAGFIIGASLQSVGNVTTSASYIDNALELATVTKMIRISLLVFVLLFFSFKDSGNNTANKVKFQLPLFIIFFIIFLVLSNLFTLPTTFINVSKSIQKFTLVMSLCAIGLNINIKKILTRVEKSLILGALVHLVQIILVIVFSYLIF